MDFEFLQRFVDQAASVGVHRVHQICRGVDIRGVVIADVARVKAARFNPEEGFVARVKERWGVESGTNGVGSAV